MHHNKSQTDIWQVWLCFVTPTRRMLRQEHYKNRAEYVPRDLKVTHSEILSPPKLEKLPQSLNRQPKVRDISQKHFPSQEQNGHQ